MGSRLVLVPDRPSWARRIPRGIGLDKESVGRLLRELRIYDGKLGSFAREHELPPHGLAKALQLHYPSFWKWYKEAHPEQQFAECPSCHAEFALHRRGQETCGAGWCLGLHRRDREYFGGKRSTAIGMSDLVCQLCGKPITKNAQAHHVFGRDSDTMVAFHSGCHQLVENVARRHFPEDEAGWERLIQYVLAKRYGSGVVASVTILPSMKQAS
jgi:hypothetical protein